MPHSFKRYERLCHLIDVVLGIEITYVCERSSLTDFTPLDSPEMVALQAAIQAEYGKKIDISDSKHLYLHQILDLLYGEDATGAG